MKLMLTFYPSKSVRLYYTLKCAILLLLASFVMPVVVSSNTTPTLNQPSFIENKGQFSSQVLFVAFTPTADIWITKTAIIQDFHTGTTPLISMEISGSKFLKSIPSEMLSGQINYFHSSSQITGVHRYGEVILSNVSDGIDMRWYFDNGQPRYDFIIKPGANPKNAFIVFKDIKNLTLNSNGELCFENDINGQQRHQGLLAYQTSNNGKNVVPCKFGIYNNTMGDQTVGFKVGNYDTSKPLIIDPVIMGSFFGGSGIDKINDIKLDEMGNIYVAGSTSSPGDLPLISSHYRLNYGESTGNSDGFFAKFSKDGKSLVYYNIIGGMLTDEIVSLVLDKSNSVYIGGNTNSSKLNGFPITLGAPDSVLGIQDENSGFVSKFTNEGSSLEFCTYIGGEKFESISKIAYDETAEAIHIVGATNDVNPLPFNKNTTIGEGDAFYQAISIPERRILFSGYLGGSGKDIATSLAIDLVKLYAKHARDLTAMPWAELEDLLKKAGQLKDPPPKTGFGY
ncbi:MAG: SBBP repeat-containing protein [Ignavibacteriae bacterium]|nr:SBBP repeat-containing protein [Ignavibacteriota bacterium]